jgi:hypothetical protein
LIFRTGQTTCQQCSAGKYCPSSTGGESNVPGGSYSEQGWTYYRPCPAGYSCSGGILGSVCADGTYSAEGVDACSACGVGKECPNLDQQFTCVEGYYSNGNQRYCTACEVGYYCNSGTKYTCGHLYYTDQTGMSSCRPVPRHWVANSLTAASSVTQCTENQYTDAMQLACYNCDDMHQCFRDDHVEPCAFGWAKINGDWFCRPCPPGFVCSVSATVGSTTTAAISTLHTSYDANKAYPLFSPVAEMTEFACPPNTYCSPDGTDYHICPHGYYPTGDGCTSCADGKYCMTSFRRIKTVTTGSVSSNKDSFPRFQPQGYIWNNAWSTPKSFTSTTTAKGRVDGATTALEFNCPQGYSCTHSMYARCPSTHQGKLFGTSNVGMVAESQEIKHKGVFGTWFKKKKIGGA